MRISKKNIKLVELPRPLLPHDSWQAKRQSGAVSRGKNNNWNLDLPHDVTVRQLAHPHLKNDLVKQKTR